MPLSGSQATSIVCIILALGYNILLWAMMINNRHHQNLIARNVKASGFLLCLSLICQLQFFTAKYVQEDIGTGAIASTTVSFPLVLCQCGIYVLNISSLLFKLQLSKELMQTQNFQKTLADLPASQRWFADHKFLLTREAISIGIVMWILICFIGPICFFAGAIPRRNVQYGNVAIAFVFLVLLLLVFWMSRSEKERWGVKLELSIMLGLSFATVVFLVLINFLALDSYELAVNVVVQLFYFIVLSGISTVAVGIPAYQAMQETKNGGHSVHVEMENVASNGQQGQLDDDVLLEFDKLLTDPRFYVIFEEHLEMEMSSENLAFWSEVQKYKRKIDLSIQADVMDDEVIDKIRDNFTEIYGRFIAQDAETQVNISRECQLDVIEKAKPILDGDLPSRPQDSIKLFATILNDAEKMVFDLMRDDSFKRFMQMDKFIEYRSQALAERVLTKTTGTSTLSRNNTNNTVRGKKPTANDVLGTVSGGTAI